MFHDIRTTSDTVMRARCEGFEPPARWRNDGLRRVQADRYTPVHIIHLMERCERTGANVVMKRRETLPR